MYLFNKVWMDLCHVLAYVSKTQVNYFFLFVFVIIKLLSFLYLDVNKVSPTIHISQTVTHTHLSIQ